MSAPTKVKQMHPIIEGLNILTKYYPNAEFSAAHDQIFYAPYEPEKISNEDLARLKELRWFEEHDSWSHSC